MSGLSAEAKRRFARDVGLRIRDMRLLRGLSRKELGSAIRMHVNALQRIEVGRTLPSLETLYRLAKGLGMEIDCLLPEGY
jgi:transcriptional regulator with XRE-family HTH domain